LTSKEFSNADEYVHTILSALVKPDVATDEDMISGMLLVFEDFGITFQKYPSFLFFVLLFLIHTRTPIYDLNSRYVKKKLERKQNNKSQHSIFEPGIAAGESRPEPLSQRSSTKLPVKNFYEKVLQCNI
jgi:hypothetical protein